MATNNFKPFATAANANVMSQADWEALPALLSGFISGPAKSAQVNKAIRQASFIAAALAQYTANKSGLDVLDDGDLNGFISKMGTAFGKDFQALDATLTALAGLATGANKLPYFTGNDTAAQTDLTSVGRDIIGKNTIADILTYLGLSDVMKTGDFGLGVKNETKPGGMAALGVTQFDYFEPADNIGPLPGSWCGGLSYAMGDDIGFQLAGSGQLQPNENPRLFFRSKFADKKFTQWGEIYHTLNKPTASDLGITLGTAASRDVGTGANQIPDMSSFTSGGNADARWRKLPDGTIEQFGIVNGMTTNAVTVAYPIAFPSELTSFEVAATGDLLASSYNTVNIAATPAQGNNLTHFSATGYNTFTDGRTALNNVMFYWRAIGR
ncbi:gp53-like domain-containing protein [Citrobacter freundii]